MEKLNPSENAIEVRPKNSLDPEVVPKIVIPIGFASIWDAKEKAKLYDFSYNEIPTEDKIPTIQANITDYLNERFSTTESPLRPHQRNVFEDLAQFFADIEQGERTGYVRLPTGTGKTVIFVELCKALLGKNDDD